MDSSGIAVNRSMPLAKLVILCLGEPVWARYDQPWTPWFLRRNEILVELDEQALD
jgi:hypothetical protein